LEPRLHTLGMSKHDCVCIGDMNINVLNYDQNKATNEYLNCFLTRNFIPALLLPTRITDKTCTLIDHIFYKARKDIKNAQTIFSGNIFADISDHLPGFLIFKKENSQTVLKDTRPLIRLNNQANLDKFSNALQNWNWNMTLYSEENVIEAFNKFQNILKTNYESSFPLIRLSKKATK